MESVAFFLYPKKTNWHLLRSLPHYWLKKCDKGYGRATVAVDLLQVNLMSSWWAEQAF